MVPLYWSMDSINCATVPYKFCMSRPGQDALHTYAAAHLPPHAACPVLAGLLRTVEAEAGLCVKADMSVKFLDED